MSETQIAAGDRPATGDKAKKRGRAKLLEGVVVSDKMEKSVVVDITTHKRHAAYGKFVKRSKRYVAHDEKNDAHVGDRVQIVETRPLSKTKRWRLQKVVERAV